MAKSLDAWIYNFTVTDCATHREGYTVYKITSIVFPVYVPESLTCLKVWKRFSEIKILRKYIAKRHKDLHLRGNVPELSIDENGSFFKRIDETIIQKRKEYILKLLDFISQHSALYRSHEFIQFFESSHTPTQLSPTATTVRRRREQRQQYGHQHHRPSSKKSINNNNDDNKMCGRLALVSADGVSVVGGGGGGGNIEAICDENNIPYDKQNFNITNSKRYDLINDNSGSDSDVDSDEHQHCYDQNSISQSSCSVISDSTSSTCSDPILMPIVYGTEVLPKDEPSIKTNQIINSLPTSSSSQTEIQSTIKPTTTTDGLVIESSADYIYEAALEFSEAVQAEVNQRYHDAFERYKQGISKLINGARHDVREERKRIAKDKIQKYLSRAEQIHEIYIVGGGGGGSGGGGGNNDDGQSSSNTMANLTENNLPSQINQNNNGIGYLNGNGSNLSIPLSINDERTLEFPINQLSKYKVMKVLDSVMQVQNVTNKKVFIMKAIEKPSSNNLPQTIYLPHSIPFMVSLIGYFQSDTTIYVLIQQANGGRLIDYIKSYSPPRILSNPNRTSSLASLFSEPHDPLVIINQSNIPDGLYKTDGGFIDVLKKYRTNNYENLQINKIEHNLNIPDYGVLSRDMDVADLLNCSQKLLNSVSTTLEQFSGQQIKTNESIDEQELTIEIATNIKDIEKEIINESSSSSVVTPPSPTPPSPTPPQLQSDQQIIPTKHLVHRMPERSIKRWASEIVTALHYLHLRGVICMDLHPRNLLLGNKGEMQLTYFYHQTNKQLNLCAMDELYVAPERPLTELSDWWSFGVILFELLTGQQFITCHPGGISSYYEIQYPEDVQLSNDSKDLLQQLIQTNLELRIDEQAICEHRFFENIRWDWLQKISDNGGIIMRSPEAESAYSSNFIYCD